VNRARMAKAAKSCGITPSVMRQQVLDRICRYHETADEAISKVEQQSRNRHRLDCAELGAYRKYHMPAVSREWWQ